MSLVTIKKVLIIFLSCFFISNSYAQGWEKFFPVDGDTLLRAKTLCETIDQGYILAGQSYDKNSAVSKSHLIKTDINGDLLWRKSYDFIPTISEIKQTSDKGYILIGFDLPDYNIVSYTSNMYLVKIDIEGDTLWTKKFGNTNKRDQFLCLEVISDGYIITGHSNDHVAENYNAFLMKTDLYGNLVWKKDYINPAPINTFVTGMEQTSDGGYLLVGHNVDSTGLPLRAYALKTNAAGDTLWTKRYPSGGADYFADIKETSDGGYIYIGGANTSTGAGKYDYYVVKTDVNGNIIWTNMYGDVHTEYAKSIVETADGGYYIVGASNSLDTSFYARYTLKINGFGGIEWVNTFGNIEGGAVEGLLSTDGYTFIASTPSQVFPGERVIHLVRTDLSGQARTNSIRGNVFNDLDFSCTKDIGEQNLGAILIEAIGVDTFYATTDSLGNYAMLVDTGSYVVSINTSIYTQPCNNSVPVNISGVSTIDTVNFALQAQVACALMQVDLSAPFLVKDSLASNYVVSYCNKGTISANDVRVQFILDANLILLNTSIPIDSQSNDTLIFDIGTVMSGDCGNFVLEVTVDPTAILGQTHCSEVHISPDSICLLNSWTGPILDADATCLLTDSVQFKVENIGLNSFNPQTYYVFEDYFIMLTGSTGSIPVGGFFNLTIPTDTGKTYRIEVAQMLNYPSLLGDSIASATIEGCKTYPDGSFNTGYVTQFSNGNSAPFAAIDCQENVDHYEANDKSAQPKGHGTQHYIYDDTEIDYKIRFQNRGTDTVSLVVVRDTISPHLDLRTLEMGASSHPYTWRVYGDGILEIRYENIMLPDSLTNPLASNVFVRYRIAQKSGNSRGTIIYNAADIYFDYDAPVVSNQTKHTVENNFVPIYLVIGVVLDEKLEVNVYPNPFTNYTTIAVKGKDYGQLDLKVYDLMGRLITQEQAYSNNRIELHRNNLQAGVYLYQLEGDGELINTGKVVVQ